MAKHKKKIKSKKKASKKTADQAEETKRSEDWPDEFDDPQFFIDYVLERKKVADAATKGLRKTWTELWQLYQSKQDYSGKEDWQSRIFSPRIFTHTTRAAGMVERAMLRTSTLFKVEPDEEYYEESKLKAAKEKARKAEKKLKSHLEKTNFVDSCGEATTSGFLLGFGAPKRIWGEEEMVNFENTDVFNLYIDPEYMPFVHKKPGYIIERKEEKLAILIDKAKKAPDVYDMNAIERINADEGEKQEIKHKERSRRGISEHKTQGKPVVILQFWGDVISKDGRHILRDQLIEVANEKELIRHHENPHDDKLPPWRFIIALPYPHRGIAGTSLVGGAVTLQYTLNNLLNLYMDNLNFTVNKMYEINTPELTDPKQSNRIYPGKKFLTSSKDRVIREIQSTSVGGEVVNAIRVVDSELRQATAVTEYVEALPSKRQQTKGEYEGKTAAGQSYFDVIARRLERRCLGPLIEDAWNLIIQFKRKIFKGLEGHYLFKVGGLSLLLQEEKLRGEIDTLLGAALKSEKLAERTDIDVLWKKRLTFANLQEAYKEPEEAEQTGRTPEEGARKARQDFGRLGLAGQMRLLQTVGQNAVNAGAA